MRNIFKVYFILLEFLAKRLPVTVVSVNESTRFFKSNTFISNIRLKLAKSQEKGKQHPVAKLYYLKIIFFLHARYYPKIGHPKECVIKRVCLFLRLMIN